MSDYDVDEEIFGEDEEIGDAPAEEPQAFSAAGERRTYHVKPGCAIKQGGKEFTEGEPVELTASQAERLRDHVA